MTNAEWCIKEGISFKYLWARFSDKDKKWIIVESSNLAFKEVGILKAIGEIKIPDIATAFRAVLYWLDMEHEKQILDDVEKRYLKAVIRPWRDRVLWIARDENKDGSKSHICIKIKDEAETISLPYFDTNTMYAGMEVSKPYSLEELEL